MEVPILLSLKDICCMCLSIDRKLKKLCEFEDGINNLFFLLSCDSEAYELLCYRETTDLYICWECTALLNRMSKFREQACTAQKQLQDMVDNEKHKFNLHKGFSVLSQCHQNTYNYEYILTTNDDNQSDDEYAHGSIKSDSDPLSLSVPEIANSSNDIEEKTQEHKIINYIKIDKSIIVDESDGNVDKSDIMTDVSDMKVEELDMEIEESNPEINESDSQLETKCEEGTENNLLQENVKKKKIVVKNFIVQENINYSTIKMTASEMRDSLKQRKAEQSFIEAKYKCDSCVEVYQDTANKQLPDEAHKRAKKERKKVGKPKIPLEVKCEGKIRIIMLTTEEMLQERKAKALKNNYLKFTHKCEYCITGFDHELILKSHMEKRHSKKSNGIECKICNSVLGTKTSFDEHHKRHFIRYECIKCGKRNSYVDELLKHYKEKHGDGLKTIFSCKLCDFSTESHRVYRYHRDKHRTKNLKCELCGTIFVHKGGLKTHMFAVHGQSIRMYSCTECGKQYRSKYGLLAHAAIHAPSPAYCAGCDADFTSQLTLKHHLKYHSKHNKRRFECNECDAKFIVKKSLQDHIEWFHHNNKEHNCDKCNKVFVNSTSLKNHRQFVHEKKMLPRNKICDHCGRGFTSLAILRSHIRTHTGERPLHCAHCPATFAHSAALYTHNKLLHRKTK